MNENELKEWAVRIVKDLKAKRSVLLIGPPGCWKTMIARRAYEALGVNSDPLIWMVQRLAGMDHRSKFDRPFRAPHHTVSLMGMRGDPTRCRPGELSLAHGGVLFLDEVENFRRPIIDLVIDTWRAGAVTYGDSPWLNSLPAQFALIAASNPCPCGWPSRCSCTEEQRSLWQRGLRGRFDVVIELPEEVKV